jgi:hypothetical protein
MIFFLKWKGSLGFEVNAGFAIDLVSRGVPFKLARRLGVFSSDKGL